MAVSEAKRTSLTCASEAACKHVCVYVRNDACLYIAICAIWLWHYIVMAQPANMSMRMSGTTDVYAPASAIMSHNYIGP